MPFGFHRSPIDRHLARRAAVPSVGLALLVACGSTGPPQTNDGAGAVTVTGSERLAWNQPLHDTADVPSDFAVYIDGARASLPNVACAPATAGPLVPCSAPLPELQVGRHVLELIALRAAEGQRVESARARPLVVFKKASESVSTQSVPLGGRAIDAEEEGYRVETVATGLSHPVSLAVGRTGWVLVAERHGTLKFVDARGGEQEGRVALTSNDLGDDGVVTVHDVVLHPDFERNGSVLLLYTATAPGGNTMRLVRVHEAGQTLGEPAVLFEVPSRRVDPMGAMAFGPDRKLYIATNVEDSSPDALPGRILQLNEDGTTPEDHEGPGPLVGSSVAKPVSFGWNTLTGRMWFVSRDRHRTSREEGRAIDWVSSGDAQGAILYTGQAFPALQEALLVARGQQGGLEWMRFDPASSSWVTHGFLMSRSFGRVEALAQGPEGFLYVATSTSEALTGRAQIVRIVPGDLSSSGRFDTPTPGESPKQ